MSGQKYHLFTIRLLAEARRQLPGRHVSRCIKYFLNIILRYRADILPSVDVATTQRQKDPIPETNRRKIVSCPKGQLMTVVSAIVAVAAAVNVLCVTVPPERTWCRTCNDVFLSLLTATSQDSLSRPLIRNVSLRLYVLVQAPSIFASTGKADCCCLSCKGGRTSNGFSYIG